MRQFGRSLTPVWADAVLEGLVDIWPNAGGAPVLQRIPIDASQRRHRSRRLLRAIPLHFALRQRIKASRQRFDIRNIQILVNQEPCKQMHLTAGPCEVL